MIDKMISDLYYSASFLSTITLNIGIHVDAHFV